MREELLGRDGSGRAYWVLGRGLGARSWLCRLTVVRQLFGPHVALPLPSVGPSEAPKGLGKAWKGLDKAPKGL